MSRADLEAFLVDRGFDVYERSDRPPHLQVRHAGNNELDSTGSLDAYNVYVVISRHHDTQPLAREVWTELRKSSRYTPLEMTVTYGDVPPGSEDEWDVATIAVADCQFDA